MPICTIITYQPNCPRSGRWDTGWRTLPLTLLERPRHGAWELELEGLPAMAIADGRLGVVPAGWRHRLRKRGADDGMTSCWCYLRWSDDAGTPLAIPSRPQVIAGEAPTLIDALAEGSGSVALARRQRAAWRLLELIAAAGPAAPAERDPRIARLLAWLQAHLHEPLTRDDLATEAGCSATRLHDLCVAALNVAPMRLLASLRISRAQELLLGSDLALGEIAARSGFSSPFWFSRAFRTACGQTPSAYRAAHRGS